MNTGYIFRWKQEAIYAAVTFAVYILGEFTLTDIETTDWKTWVVATLVGGARVVAAAILPRLGGLIGK